MLNRKSWAACMVGFTSAWFGQYIGEAIVGDVKGGSLIVFGIIWLIATIWSIHVRAFNK